MRPIKLNRTLFFPKINNKNFNILAYGDAFSKLGDMAQGIALAAYVYTLTDSAAVFGLLLFLRFAPEFIIAPFSGIIVDKFSRRYLTTILNVCLGIISILLTLFINNITAILLLSFLSSLFLFPYRPAISSSLPFMVQKSKLQVANGIMGTLAGIARIIGATIAAFGLILQSIELILLFNAFTFFVAGISTWITIPKKQIEDVNFEKEQSFNNNDSISFFESIRFLAKSKKLFNLIIGSTLLWGCVGISDVLLVPTLGESLDGGEDFYGIYRIIAAIGMAVGSYFSIFWFNKLTSNKKVSIGFNLPIFMMALCTVGLALFPLSAGYIFYFLIWLLLFVPSNLLEVELQNTPNKIRGKLTAIADAIDSILFSFMTLILPQFSMSSQNLMLYTSLIFVLVSLALLIKPKSEQDTMVKAY